MKMSFTKIVTPDGKATPQMLAYLLAARDGVPMSDEIFETLLGKDYLAYDLTQDQDEYATWVLETEYETIDAFSQACARLLKRAFDHPAIARCALMFDGTYDGPESTIDFEKSGYIYGLTTKSTGPVLCMDINILQSDSWAQLIEFVYRRG